MSEWYKLIIHPSLLEYDYRIAWTWDEMNNRNERNFMVDKLRIAYGMNARPYWRPLYSIWKTHWGKDRPLPEIPDWR